MPDSKYEDKSIEELEAMLNNPDSIGKTEAEPVVATTSTETPVEPVVETPVVETPPVVATTPETIPEAPPEPEPDVRAMEAEAARVERERLEVTLEKLQLHNSRLASQIGELKKNQSRAGTEYPEIPQDDERIVELRNTVAQLQSAQRTEARNRVVSEEIRSVLDKPYLKGVDPGLVTAATQKYQAAWDEAVAEDDPDLARLNARTVLLSVAAEARRNQLEQVTTAARERSVEQTRVATSAKLKASVSGGGSAPQPTPAKKLEDYTAPELAKMLDELTR